MSCRVGRRAAGPHAALALRQGARPPAGKPGMLTLVFLCFLLFFLLKVESGDRSGSGIHLSPFTQCYFTLALARGAPPV